MLNALLIIITYEIVKTVLRKIWDKFINDD